MNLLKHLFKKKEVVKPNLDFDNSETILEYIIKLYNEIWKDQGKWKANLNEIELVLNKLLLKVPYDTRVLTNLGTVLSDKGRYPEALQVLQKAESLGSIDSNLYMSIGIVKMNLPNERPYAKDYFNKATKLSKNKYTIEPYFDPHAY